MTDFDFIIVGKGMMGASAARHLSASGARIALIGPDEPLNKARHDGVFASHYDEGRITRSLDGNAVWGRLAQRSISRYRDIEAESGISFFNESGCLMVGDLSGEGTSFIQSVIGVRDALGVKAEVLSQPDMATSFPCFSFSSPSVGVFEAKGAGTINPRALVRAQTVCAQNANVDVISQQVVHVEDEAGRVRVTLRDGRWYTAGRVLLAAGGFSRNANLGTGDLDLTVKARTVLFLEVDEAQHAEFAHMPSLIVENGRQEDSIYLLPPIRYPDGRMFIKIGGDPVDRILNGDTEICDWFRTDGSASVGDHLHAIVKRLIPSLRPASLTTNSCVTVFTAHGYPYIGFSDSSRLAILTGGNGAAAKSCDEIGRLGARLILNGTFDAPEYETDFAVHKQ